MKHTANVNADALGNRLARELPGLPIVWGPRLFESIRDNATVRGLFIEWLKRLEERR